ncbi:MAG TPA: hypothetical protein ENI16_00505 [Candidatus Portnoybacteria bacterium]|nr:hypothetical protein [Candidatus Portnoybacteria bacterium]
MFKLFKEKCPICGMELKKGEDYIKEHGKKFCSEECREEYQKKLTKGQSKTTGGGCCH